MDDRATTRRMLLGIEVTLFGGIFMAASSGSAQALRLGIAALGLLIAMVGFGTGPR
jgi:hypothetical protein